MPKKPAHIDPEDEKAIASRLREARERQGITQVDLCLQLGMSQSLLSRYERGELRLHGALLAKMARALKTSADEILGLQSLEGESSIKDRRFLRRLSSIDRLPKREKQSLLDTIDAYIGKAS